MNESQFNLIAEKLIKSTVQREAVKQNLLYDIPANKAEKEAYDSATNTVGRDAKRVKSEYDFIQKVASAK